MRNHDSRKHLPGFCSFQFLIPQFLCGDFFNSIDPTETSAANFAVMHNAAFSTTMW